jgi:hypothetical protein
VKSKEGNACPNSWIKTVAKFQNKMPKMRRRMPQPVFNKAERESLNKGKVILRRSWFVIMDAWFLLRIIFGKPP